jgi:type I restriction enzyme, S subunit
VSERTVPVTRQRFKPYPAYKDSGVAWLGEIPVGWEVKRLKTLASVELSNVDKKSVDGQEIVQLCNYTDVYYNERITGVLEFMPATATREQVRRFSLRTGDVLITKDSESWTDIAVPAVVAEDLPGVLCGYHLAHIRPGADYDGAFLSRAFAAVGPRDQFQVAANGITRFGLGGGAIRTGIFPVPPEPEQRAIAAFLNRETARIDGLVAKKERLIELLQEQRTALITRAVTKGLDPNVPMKDSGVEWLGEIPAHWEVKKTTWLFSVGSGTTPKSEDLGYYGGETPWITTSELRESVVLTTEKYVTQAARREHSSLKLHPAGSVAVAMYGATIGRLGVLGVDATVNQACCVFSKPRGIGMQFWFYWLQMRRPYLISLGYGGGQPNLSQDLLRSVRVPTPPLPEQHAIAAFLDRETARIDTLTTKIREAVERLKELRTALISAAVTGKIDVREEVA